MRLHNAFAGGIWLWVLGFGGALAAAERAHPWLLLTAADVERARDGVAHNAAFAALGRQLVERAATNRVEGLPPLERQWWDSAKARPWKETYPPVFHHTFTVPLKWADAARACAQANVIAPSAQLAANAKRLLLSLSDYTFEFEHYDVGMNYTIWALAALETYDLLYGDFTAAERAKLDAFFGRYLAALRKNDDYWIEHEPGGTLNNHYAWHKLGLAMMGLFYGKPELVEHALHGPKGIDNMLAHGFKDDGLWLEGSIPYQFAETAPLVILARLLENAGNPESLFRYRSPNGYSLKKSYDALIPLLLPDRTLPPLGDAYARRPHIATHPDWELLFREFRAAEYAWLLNDRGARTPQALFWGIPSLPAAGPPPQPSKVWPEMGFVALRSQETTNYWSGHGWTVFATFSGQTVHDHADKLSIMAFAEGHLWLADCEARSSAEHAFSSAVQTTLNRETLCHNTLLVDGKSQRRTGQRLDLLEFTNSPTLKRVTLADRNGRLYAGVRQLRTLLVCQDYLLDFMQAASTSPHAYTWLTHIDGRPAAGSLGVTNPVTLPPGAPWSWLRDPKGAGATNRTWERFSNGNDNLRLDVLTGVPAEITHCGFPREDRGEASTIPMRLFTQQGTNAWVLALCRIVKQPGDSAELSVATSTPGGITITVRIGGRVYPHTVPAL